MKKCTNCLIEKDIKQFNKGKNKNSWIVSICKQCSRKKDIEYSHTEKWVISRIYAHQKEKSKRRWYEYPKYTKEELSNWLYENWFKDLFDKWSESWFDTKLKPSVDRIDDYKTYYIWNIQLITWDQNNRKAHRDRRLWINTKWSKSIVWTNIENWTKIHFISIIDAERNWFNKTWTWRSLKWKAESYKWYKWEYN